MEFGNYYDRVFWNGETRQRRRTMESSPSVGSAKEQVRDILEALSDDASLEEIQHHIDIRQKIGQGWDGTDAGRMIGLEEVQLRLADWLTKWSSRAWSAAR